MKKSTFFKLAAITAIILFCLMLGKCCDAQAQTKYVELNHRFFTDCPECPTILEIAKSKPIVKHSTATMQVKRTIKPIEKVQYQPPKHCDTIVIKNEVYVTVNLPSPVETKANLYEPCHKGKYRKEIGYDELLAYGKYKDRGTGKIIAGASFQIVALGILAYANIPQYEFHDVTVTQHLPYTYTEYELVQVPSSDGLKCGHNPPKPTPEPAQYITNVTQNVTVEQTVVVNNYTTVVVTAPAYVLVPHTVTKYLDVKSTSQVVTKTYPNKAICNTTAILLGFAGLAFEWSGINDLHKGNMLIGYRKFGYTRRF